MPVGEPCVYPSKPQLFDLEADPHCTRDLKGTHPDVYERLAAKLPEDEASVPVILVHAGEYSAALLVDEMLVYAGVLHGLHGMTARVRYRLRHPFHDGTRAVIFDPLTFIGKLCALVPPPGRIW